MNHSNRCILVSASVVLAALLSNASPASAMGRSTQPSAASAMPDDPIRASQLSKPTDTALQSQVDTLRKELADLKAQIAIRRGLASSD